MEEQFKKSYRIDVRCRRADAAKFRRFHLQFARPRCAGPVVSMANTNAPWWDVIGILRLAVRTPTLFTAVIRSSSGLRLIAVGNDGHTRVIASGDSDLLAAFENGIADERLRYFRDVAAATESEMSVS